MWMCERHTCRVCVILRALPNINTEMIPHAMAVYLCLLSYTQHQSVALPPFQTDPIASFKHKFTGGGAP